MRQTHYNEDTLVQQTTADYLHEALGWDSVYAYNQETFGPDGLLGRDSDREVLLVRYLREKLEELVQQRTEKLLEEEKVLEILFEISQAVYTTADLKEFLATVQKKIGQLMDARNFYVALYDPETGKYKFPYSADEYDDYSPYAAEDLRFTPTDYVRRKGPLLADPAVHAQMVKSGEVARRVGTNALIWLGVPLLVPGKSEAIGVMTVQSYDNSRCYTEKEKKIMMHISTTVALAIDRITLVSDLFHHFNNAVTSIRGNAEILLRANEEKTKWLERLERYARHYAEGGKGGGPRAAAELERIVQFLSKARENSESRIGKIIAGIEDASRRMNVAFGPVITNDRQENL